MKRVIRLLFKVFLLSFFFLLLFINTRLYYQADFQKDSGYNKDVYHQVQFLKAKLEGGAAEDMQAVFPEGAIFINALYGLTWCDLVEPLPSAHPLNEEAIQELEKVMETISSPRAKSIFSKDQILEHGAFYNGWSNYLHARKLALQLPSQWDQVEIVRFQKNCETIAEAMRKSSSPYLTSYNGLAWPADMLLVVAALKKHDELFPPLYEDLIETWLSKVKTRLDPRTQLIPHEVNATDGSTLQGARGSSQSLILNFLYEIDLIFSEQQFKLYNAQFLDSRFGLPGIREYPKGLSGEGDIDSGPVLFGIGGAASIVGQRTMGLHGDWETYEGLRNCIGAFGIPCTLNAQRCYILGQLPIADAFIAWSNAIENQPNHYENVPNWRWKFQLASLVVGLVLGFLFVRL